MTEPPERGGASVDPRIPGAGAYGCLESWQQAAYRLQADLAQARRELARAEQVIASGVKSYEPQGGASVEVDREAWIERLVREHREALAELAKCQEGWSRELDESVRRESVIRADLTQARAERDKLKDAFDIMRNVADRRKGQREQLRAQNQVMRGVVEGSNRCEQHEHFHGGCPCNCHDVALAQTQPAR